MELQTVYRILLAATIGSALVLHLVVFVALKVYRVQISFARSIKPGIIDNLYRLSPNAHSLWLGILVRLASLSKIPAVLAAVVFFVLRNLTR